ncbi:MAG: hypothetical protein L0Y71_11095 [Gemmataceae bacterium]|nr:hypothetical protein [Gemmataceae bacterium]
MAKRWSVGLALAAALPFTALPLTARAGGADKPAAVVRVRSLDTLVDNAKLLVSLAGREEIAKQVEGLIKAKIGVQGLEGIDPARPLGAYAVFGKQLDDIGGAILIPIADERAFLGLLENLSYKATKGKNDIYSIQTGAPVEIFLRFANRYAYVTALNAAALEGKLVDPVQVLGKDGPTFAATVRIDQLPEAARQLAIGQIEQGLQDLAAKDIPGETAGQRAVRTAAVKEFGKHVVGVLKDGGEFSLTIDLDAKKNELSAKVALAGKPGTELAQTIQKLGQGTSQFGTMRGANAAFRGLSHVVLPAEIHKGLNKILDEGAAQSLAKIQDARKREQAQQLLDVLMPTLKAGEIDGCIQLLGPSADQKYAVVAALKVKGGVKLGATLRELVSDALKQAPDAQRNKVQFDHASAGAVKIHRLELPADQEPVRKLQEALGESNLYVAFREDAVFVAVGKDSLPAIKDAITAQSTGPSPLFLYELDMARLAPLLAPTKELRASAKKIFPGGKDGLVRLSLEGGTALRFTLTARLPVVQFLSQTRELKAPE